MSAEPRVALCVARFYAELAARLERGAREALAEADVDDVPAFSVPGAFELPTIALYAARSGRFDGVALDTGVPCGFGVLTVDTMEQALARVSGGDKRDTGEHAVEAVLAALAVRRQLQSPS